MSWQLRCRTRWGSNRRPVWVSVTDLSRKNRGNLSVCSPKMEPGRVRTGAGRIVGMTNTITTDLDQGHPIDAAVTELTSANDAAQLIGETCLTDGPVGRVGLEIEAHCFDLAEP